MIKYYSISALLYDTPMLTDTQKFIYIRMLKDAVFSDEYDFRGYKLKHGQLLLTQSKMAEYGSKNTVIATLKRLEELGEITTEKLTGRYHYGNGTLITFIYYDECIISPSSPSELTPTRKLIESKMTQSLGQNRLNHLVKFDSSTELTRENNSNNQTSVCEGAIAPVDDDYTRYHKKVSDLHPGSSDTTDFDSLLDKFAY